MSLRTFLYGPGIRDVLDRGEQLLAVAPFNFLGGDTSGLEPTFEELTPRQRELAERGELPKPSNRWFTGFSWFPLDFGPEVNPDRIDRLLGGRVGVGTGDSPAGRLWRLRKLAKSGESVLCAVTDRRLLLLQTCRAERSIPEPTPVEVLGEVPSESIVGARWCPRFLIFGRITIRFTDGSSLSPSASLLLPMDPLRIVSALKKVTRQPRKRLDE